MRGAPSIFPTQRARTSHTAASTPTSPTPAARPKKVSPYRLVPAHTFLADFAPLHANGWRLNSLVNPSSDEAGGRAALSEDGDLQDYELVRTYGFELTKEGWKRAAGLVQQIAEVVEQQDVSITW